MVVGEERKQRLSDMHVLFSAHVRGRNCAFRENIKAVILMS
jgi:hypothetical protein